MTTTSTDYWPTPAAARALRDLGTPGHPAARRSDRSVNTLRQNGLLTVDENQQAHLTPAGTALATDLGLLCGQQDRPHTRHTGCEGPAAVLTGGPYDPCSRNTSCRLLFAHEGDCWAPPLISSD